MKSIFKERPESFAASATATKHPKQKDGAQPTEAKPPGFVDRVLSIFADEDAKLAKQQEELEAKKGTTLAQIGKYKTLKRERDQAALRLERADEEFTEAQALRAQLAAGATSHAWGAAGHPGNIYHTQKPWQSYAVLPALDLAIADFPNARQIIEEELEQAQERLNTFVAKFGSAPDVD